MKRYLWPVLAIFLLIGLFSCTPPSTPEASPTEEATEEINTECQPVAPMDGAETVLIPNGTFKMGSVLTDEKADGDEFPEHNVTLSCFNIYKKEVTNSMYAGCVAAGGCSDVISIPGTLTERYTNPGYADYPVVGVDYTMARAYCEWVGGRLPTEAEWEYTATRSGTIVYPWGDEDANCDRANYLDCFDPAEPVLAGTLIEGASPFEVLDLAGNVWEWVFDWYFDDYYHDSPAVNPTGPATGETKVVRGGAYNSEVEMLEAANRQAGDPYMAYTNTGFRCVIGAGLNLPVFQEEPIPDLHEVPLGDDDPGDDPEGPGYIIVQTLPLNCPDGNGNLHFQYHINATIPFTIIGLDVEGIPYACDPYDVANQTLTCIGPQPAPTPTDKWNAVLTLISPALMQPVHFGLPFSKPLDCEGKQTPLKFDGTQACPLNGLFPMTLYFQPAIEWTVMENTFGDPVECVYNNLNEMACLAPDVKDNGRYRFHFEGQYESELYVVNFSYIPLNGCGPSTTQTAELLGICSNDEPSLLVAYGPENTPPNLVTSDGEQLTCEPAMGNMIMCSIPDTQQGQTVAASACFGSDCTEKSVDIPACGTSEGFIDPLINPYCEEGDSLLYIFSDSENDIDPAPVQVGWDDIASTCVRGPDTVYNIATCDISDWWFEGTSQNIRVCYGSDCVEEVHQIPYCYAETNSYAYTYCEEGQPMLGILYTPVTDSMLTSVKVENTELDCEVIAPGKAKCPISPFLAGANKSTTVCVNDQCRQEIHDIPSCSATEEVSYHCQFYPATCINETTIAFLVDQYVEEPIALEPGSVWASLGSITYSCELIPSVEGRIYCAGPHPGETINTLAVFSTWLADGSEQVCYLPPAQFNALTPGCVQPDEPDQPQPTCSTYTTEATCRAAGCTPILEAPPLGGIPVFKGCK